jgi:hypothetical protein
VSFSLVRCRIVRPTLIALLAAGAGCTAPRAGALGGLPATRKLPETSLPPGYRRVVFRWDYRERVFSGRGTGVARIAPPDSVRLDFFLENGAGAGFVILIGDSLATPGDAPVGRYVPPVPMLWAALGRITFTARDTTVHVDGDTLRAEIGRDPTWRIAFGADQPVRVERIIGGRIEDMVERTDSTRVVYRQPRNARMLSLTVTARYNEVAFNEAIWRP